MRPSIIAVLLPLAITLVGCQTAPRELAACKESVNLELAYWQSYFQRVYPGFRQRYPDCRKLTTEELLVMLKNPDWTYAEPAFEELGRRDDPTTYECLVTVVEDPKEDYRYRVWAREILERASGIRTTMDDDRSEMSYTAFNDDMKTFATLTKPWLYRKANRSSVP